MNLEDRIKDQAKLIKELLEERNLLKGLIALCMRNHIRWDPERKEWAYSASGVVWYDADNAKPTFDGAVMALAARRVTNRRNYRDKKEQIEIDMQKLRSENESLKLEVLQLRQIQNHYRLKQTSSDVPSMIDIHRQRAHPSTWTGLDWLLLRGRLMSCNNLLCTRQHCTCDTKNVEVTAVEQPGLMSMFESIRTKRDEIETLREQLACAEHVIAQLSAEVIELRADSQAAFKDPFEPTAEYRRLKEAFLGSLRQGDDPDQYQIMHHQE